MQHQVVHVTSAVIVAVVGAVALGYYIKGVAGLGEAIPLATVGPLVMPLSDLVALITALDLVGGLVTLQLAQTGLLVRSDVQYLLPLGLGIGVGVGCLAVVATSTLVGIVAVLLTLVALWLMWNLYVSQRAMETGSAPYGSGKWVTAGLTSYAGLSGGVTGVEGPPLAAALIAANADTDIRPRLMRLLVDSALLRMVMLVVAGLASWGMLILAVVLLPLAGAAFVVGRKIHPSVSSGVISMLCAAMCLASAAALVVR